MEPNTLEVIFYVRIEGSPTERIERLNRAFGYLTIAKEQMEGLVSVDWEPVS